MTHHRITLSLPMPPSVNNTHGVRSGRKPKFGKALVPLERADGTPLSIPAAIWRKKGRAALAGVETDRIFMGFGARAEVYRQPHYVRWIRDASTEILAARPRLPMRELPAGWYCARMFWSADAPADTDNPVKPLLDLLSYMQITPDDRWCWGESAYRSHRIESGRCEVTVWSLRP